MATDSRIRVWHWLHATHFTLWELEISTAMGGPPCADRVLLICSTLSTMMSGNCPWAPVKSVRPEQGMSSPLIFCVLISSFRTKIYFCNIFVIALLNGAAVGVSERLSSCPSDHTWLSSHVDTSPTSYPPRELWPIALERLYPLHRWPQYQIDTRATGHLFERTRRQKVAENFLKLLLNLNPNSTP